MVDSSGRYAILFNGEIYNHNQLRKNLSKHNIIFKTNSDTEVILGFNITEGLEK